MAFNSWALTKIVHYQKEWLLLFCSLARKQNQTQQKIRKFFCAHTNASIKPGIVLVSVSCVFVVCGLKIRVTDIVRLINLSSFALGKICNRRILQHFDLLLISYALFGNKNNRQLQHNRNINGWRSAIEFLPSTISHKFCWCALMIIGNLTHNYQVPTTTQPAKIKWTDIAVLLLYNGTKLWHTFRFFCSFVWLEYVPRATTILLAAW